MQMIPNAFQVPRFMRSETDLQTTILRWAALGGLFAVPIVPLIVADDMIYPTVTGKNFVFRILVELLSGIYLLLVLRDPKYRPSFCRLFATAGAFVIWIGIANLFSVDPLRSFWGNFVRMEGYISVLHLFGFFVIAACVLGAERQWFRFFDALLIAGTVMALYCCFQLGGGGKLGSGWGVVGTLGNLTYLAVYMQSSIFIAAFILAHDSHTLSNLRSLRKILLYVAVIFFGLVLVVLISAVLTSLPYIEYFPFAAVAGLGILLAMLRNRIYFSAFILVALALQVVSLVLNGQRGPLWGAAVGLLCAAVFISWNSLHFHKQLPLQWLATVGAAIAVLLGCSTVAVLFLKQFSYVRVHLLSIAGYYDAIHARLLFVRMAWNGFLDHPLLGYGQENFDYVFSKYYEPAMFGFELWYDKAHNLSLEWLIAGGLPSFLLVILFFALVAEAFLRPSNLSIAERSMMLGLLAGYAFHSLFTFDNLVSSIYFFTIAALAQGLTQMHPGPVRVSPASNKMLALATPVVVVLTVGACWLLNGPGIANATKLLSAMKTTESVAGVERKLETNLAHFQSVLANGPHGQQEATFELLKFAGAMGTHLSSIIDIRGEPDAFYNIQRANIAKMVAELSDDGVEGKRVALIDAFYRTTHEAVMKALKQRPDNAQLEFAFGEFLNRFGQNEEAVNHLNKALLLWPNKQSLLLELGVNSYRRTNDNAKALPILRKAFELDPRYPEARGHYAVSLYDNHQDELADRLLEEGFGTLLRDAER